MVGQHEEYARRVNLVIDFIRERVTEDLPLATLARVAGFSPFHFHRVFRTVAGETVGDCVARLRLERAVALLRAAPDRRIGGVALDCGFASASVFSRAFRARYGMPPRDWDRRSPLTDSKIWQVDQSGPAYVGNREVRVRDLPATRLAYVRVQDPYGKGRVVEGFERLVEWYAGTGARRGALYGMSQDDPEVTPPSLCRFDWCVPAPPGSAAGAGVSYRRWPACRIAFVRCVGGIDEEAAAWDHLYNVWLPGSRYLPDNLPALEIYRRWPDETGWDHFDLDCAIPVTPIR